MVQVQIQSTETVPDPETATFISDIHYEITQLDSLYHWEGLSSAEADYSELCSEDGYPTIAAAQADAMYWLHRVDGCDHEQAMNWLHQLHDYFGEAVLSACAAENVNQPDLLLN